jgi:hypothetical protein
MAPRVKWTIASSFSGPTGREHARLVRQLQQLQHVLDAEFGERPLDRHAQDPPAEAASAALGASSRDRSAARARTRSAPPSAARRPRAAARRAGAARPVGTGRCVSRSTSTLTASSHGRALLQRGEAERRIAVARQRAQRARYWPPPRPAALLRGSTSASACARRPPVRVQRSHAAAPTPRLRVARRGVCGAELRQQPTSLGAPAAPARARSLPGRSPPRGRARHPACAAPRRRRREPHSRSAASTASCMRPRSSSERAAPCSARRRRRPSHRAARDLGQRLVEPFDRFTGRRAAGRSRPAAAAPPSGSRAVWPRAGQPSWPRRAGRAPAPCALHAAVGTRSRRPALLRPAAPPVAP